MTAAPLPPAAPESPLIEVDEQHPWLGLLPFKEQHGRFFFGRSAEIADLVGRIRENTLTILFGQSGLGKTSLLGAAVLPRLAAEGFTPVLLRLDYAAGAPTLLEQTRAAFRRALPGAEWPEDAAAVPLWELFHRLPGLLPPLARPPVLLFDQFEEIFTLGRQVAAREPEATQWLEEMACLLQNRPPRAFQERYAADLQLAGDYDFDPVPIRVVFSLREDYLSHLEAWKAELPLLTQNRMALLRLNGTQALEAVLGPASLGPQPLLTPEVAASLVRTAADAPPGTPLPQIRAVPPLLSLLCEQLNAARLAENAAEITAEMVTGRSKDILQRFYTESFAPFSAQQREVIRAMIEDPPMITESGYRNSLVREDAEAGLRRQGVDDPRGVFDSLIQRRLITADEKDRVQRLEVTHDVLVPLLVRSGTERRERVAKELAERTLAEEAVKTRRRRQLMAAMAVLSLLALAGGVYGLLKAGEARVQAHEARLQTGKAEAASVEAEHRSIEAKQASEERLREKQKANEQAALARRALSQADYQRAGELSKVDRDEEALAFLARAIESDPDNEMAASRLLSLLLYRNWPAEQFALDHGEPLVTGEFSADGSLILTAGASGTAKIWDARNGKLLHTLAHGSSILKAGFNPDGSRIATAGGTVVRVWESRSGTQLGTDLTHTLPVTDFSFHPAGLLLATACAPPAPEAGMQRLSKTGFVQVWNSVTGAPAMPRLRDGGGATHLAWHPNGSWLALGIDGTVELWDTGTIPRRLSLRTITGGPWPELTALTFDEAGKWLVAAAGSFTDSSATVGIVQVWDSATGRPLVPERDSDSTAPQPLYHDSWIRDVALVAEPGEAPSSGIYDAPSLKIFTATDEGVAAIWTHGGGRQVHGEKQPRGESISFATDSAQAARHEAPVERVLPFGPRCFLTVANDRATGAGYARIWTSSGDRDFPVGREDDPIAGPGGLSLREDRSVSAFSQRFEHGRFISGASWSPDGARVLTIGDDGIARLWWTVSTGAIAGITLEEPPVPSETPTGQPVTEPAAEPPAEPAEAARLDPSWITDSDKSAIRVFLKAGVVIGGPQLPPALATELARAAGAPKSGTTRYLIFSGTELYRAFRSADNRWLLTSKCGTERQAGEAIGWDLRSGKITGTFTTEAPIQDVAYTGDAERFAVAAGFKLSGSVRTFAAGTFQQIGPPIQAAGMPAGVAFFPGGRHLGVSFAHDEQRRSRVGVFDVETALPLIEPRIANYAGEPIEISADGLHLSLVNMDGTMHYEIPKIAGRAPDWLSELGRAIGCRTVDSAGSIQRMPADPLRLAALGTKVAASPDSPAKLVAQWILAAPLDRRPSPFAGLTRRASLEQEVRAKEPRRSADENVGGVFMELRDALAMHRRVFGDAALLASIESLCTQLLSSFSGEIDRLEKQRKPDELESAAAELQELRASAQGNLQIAARVNALLTHVAAARAKLSKKPKHRAGGE